ncbi:hypothetical protein N9T02_01080 [Candidatus Actinomarina]|nr:hypothetical protein [Candidatus Actinomarina sp.]|tara:strand:- start:4710 stop:5687 length:978 start_codon:yes stop_codon:yes gene_type:complete
MINFYYHPGYSKRKKKVFTLKVRSSVLVNKFINVAFFFNSTFPNRYITNGAHKCINNTLIALKKSTISNYNKGIYPNSYILQFDWYGEKVLNKLLNNDLLDKKILIGPLYTIDQLKKLATYTKDYKFIKVVAASNYSIEKLISRNDIQITRERFCVIPTGIFSEKKISTTYQSNNRNNRCLIYYKNRNMEDLNKVINFLKNRNIPYDLFEYGKYSNHKLLKTAKRNKFCILINSAESQGIAVQEMLSMNLPIYVWDLPASELNCFASSVPYFNEKCGMVTNSYDEFVNSFDKFINEYSFYRPSEYVLANLTHEKFIKNLKLQFDN